MTTLSEDLIGKIEDAKQANISVVQEFIKKQTELNTVKENEALKRENDFKDWIKNLCPPNQKPLVALSKAPPVGETNESHRKL